MTGFLYPVHGRHPGGGCWTCAHYRQAVADGAHVLCGHDGQSVKARPDNGCAFWVREPGADDELKYQDERYPDQVQPQSRAPR